MAISRISGCLVAHARRAARRFVYMGVCPVSTSRPMDNNRISPSSLPSTKQLLFHRLYSCTAPLEGQEGTSSGAAQTGLTQQETRKIFKLMKVEDFKKQLHSTGKDLMPVNELIELCKQAGVACCNTEAEEIAKSLDEAGVVLIFRGKAFLYPEKVADLLSSVMPPPLARDDDPRKEELAHLLKEKEEIERMADRQVRRMLWTALGGISLQTLLFFRLTFWELSWDVMEPITFFVTSSSIIVGFLFFILTHRDPSYQDLMHTILSSKQRKLMKKKNFNPERLKELQMQFCMVHPGKGHCVSHAI